MNGMCAWCCKLHQPRPAASLSDAWRALQNPSKPLVKNHQSIVLRAESAPEKYDWLARLKFASERSTTANQVRAYDSNQCAPQSDKH